MIKLIIFDWDDVFTLGSKEGYFACYHEALIQVGVHLTPKEEEKRIVAKWGKSHIEELRELLKEHPELIKKASQIYEENLFGNTYVGHLKIVPGSREFLIRLAKKYTLALSTGIHPKVLIKRVMPKFGIPNVFSQIITSYDIDASKTKPHPFSVEEIMRRERVAKNETVVVGDSWSDAQMAFNAGVIPIVVLTGHLDRHKAMELGITHIVEDVTKIEPVLEWLGKNSL